MDKETEIKTLQSLKGNTYFSQFFSDEDIDTMCENIRNDYAIESSCEFNDNGKYLREIHRLREEKNVLEDKERKERIAFVEEVMQHDGYSHSLEAACYDFIGERNAIIAKIKQGEEISDQDIEYITEHLS